MILVTSIFKRVVQLRSSFPEPYNGPIHNGPIPNDGISGKCWSCLRYLLPVLVVSILGMIPFNSFAAVVPTGFTDTQIVSGLTAPTAMDFTPDGRLFVCEQRGTLRVIKNGALLPTAFVSLTVDSSGERGLLGIAFDPDFAVNQYVYVYYTATTPTIHNRVSRFTANGDVAVPGSEVVLLNLNDLSSATNHNGGGIHFGPDGDLYIGVGENANPPNSQTLTNLLGKILRIAPDGSIPTSNPFYNSTTGVNRAIWAYGLRNPFTFAFQCSTGQLYINDVGQSTWEEINIGIPGANYGWPTTEGFTNDPRFVSPIFEYGHGSGDTLGCAIVGGAFYEAPITPFPLQYHGKYFFADLCNGWIRMLNPADYTVSGFATGIPNPVDLKVGQDGSLYYLAQGTGSVGRITYPTNGPAYTWQAVDVAAGSDNKARILWNNLNGSAIIWSADNSGATYGPVYGPYSGWKARAIAAGNDGSSRLLWNNTDGTAALWLMSSTGAMMSGVNFGPYPGWTAVDVTVSSDNLARILWTHTDGRIVIWSVNNAGNAGIGPIYGPYSGYTARAIASGGDSLTRVLWNRNDGAATLWLVGQSGAYDNAYEVSFGYGPFAGWTASDITVAADRQARILWTRSNGQMALWSVDTAGNAMYGPVYGPYCFYAARAISAGPDAITRVLWNESNGAAGLWQLGPDNLYRTSSGYGPY